MDRSVTAPLYRVSGLRELWIAGIANAMLWLEVLAAGLFTFQATGSGLAVAIVSAARSFPLLLTGAFIGVLSEVTATARSSRLLVCRFSKCRQPWGLLASAEDRSSPAWSSLFGRRAGGPSFG
ncbi:hypothetical protein AWB69_03741 [Caballeronia udeis]|uniref:Uncharacterized protein n=1 Tax=Caballeronia udeis TaxID=1232866 RepID=A0A158H2H4_9BURK|nr:hypothetical protein [Caballeronia udeis]SAL38231.1 hypothetical protein AWB69_03741 [Caballeronia udeis]